MNFSVGSYIGKDNSSIVVRNCSRVSRGAPRAMSAYPGRHLIDEYLNTSTPSIDIYMYFNELQVRQVNKPKLN